MDNYKYLNIYNYKVHLIYFYFCIFHYNIIYYNEIYKNKSKLNVLYNKYIVI